MLRRALLPLILVACAPKLEIDPRTRITCDDDNPCPKDFECLAGECVPKNGNQAPAITIEPIQPSTTTVTIPLTVYDQESDPVRLTIELGRNGELTELPIEAIVESSPDGVTTEIAWDAATYFAASARLADLTVRITP